MPSSTLLPTPLPANRPMRWPRPTRQQSVDRAHADIERLRDRLAQQWIDRTAGETHAGCRSRSAPGRRAAGTAPSTTRPSSFGPTRTVPACVRGSTRALGLSPCRSPVGIRYSRSPAKPTTSASIWLIVGADDLAAIAHRRLTAGRLERQPDHARQAPGHDRRRHLRSGAADSCASACVQRCAAGAIDRIHARLASRCGAALVAQHGGDGRAEALLDACVDGRSLAGDAAAAARAASDPR